MTISPAASLPSALDSAVAGIRGGFARLDAAAGRAARPGADFIEPMAQMKLAEFEVGANCAVARTAASVQGALLDILV
jgi:hypothetical protein